MPSLFWSVVRAVLVLYVAVLVLAVLFQSRLIYFPSRAAPPDRILTAGGWSLEPWRNDVDAIIGWRMSPRTGGGEATAPPAHRLVVFHGNAGSALDRLHFVEGFHGVGDGAAWDVHLFEYPGYGARPGSPGEAAFLDAAAEALGGLVRHDDRPVYLLGESLGGGVACGLAARMPERVAGLVLITPMTSLADVAARHYPLLPVKLLLRDRWDCVKALAACRSPVAFILAGRDEIVPASLGRTLFEGYGGPKRLWVQEEATHNGLDYGPGAAWWEEVTRFLLEQ